MHQKNAALHKGHDDIDNNGLEMADCQDFKRKATTVLYNSNTVEQNTRIVDNRSHSQISAKKRSTSQEFGRLRFMPISCKLVNKIT